jgi:hypothetical protein
VERFAHGDLVVNGDEVAFFNAQICGLALPNGVGQYPLTVQGSRLHFTPVGDDPCGRAAFLARYVRARRLSARPPAPRARAPARTTALETPDRWPSGAESTAASGGATDGPPGPKS